MPRNRARLIYLAGFAALASLLGGCGGSPPAHREAGEQTAQEASVRSGDVTIRASAIPTLALGEAVARQYGIERDGKTALLLVGARRGADARETAVPARITATATDLIGNRQTIALREVRSGDFVDYVGSVHVIPPDTLRFDLEIVPEGGRLATLQFNRDFFPQD